jgi:GT2 family glycosyltransferase
MDVTIITVTWNSADTIVSQMQSVVQATKGISFEHIIVDNGSTDDTVSRIQGSGYVVTLLPLKENKGFASANNEAIRHAKGRVVLFLNPDMELKDGAITTLLQTLDADPKRVIVSGKLLTPEGIMTAHLRPRPFPRRRDMMIMLLKLRRLFSKTVGQYTGAGFDDTKAQDVETVRGSFMLVRRSFIEEVGFAFDPRYFIWFEDVDVCREAKKRGYTVHYTPQAVAIDHVGQSFKKQKLFWKQYQFTKSMMQYEMKWGHPIFAALIFSIRLPLLGVVWLTDTIGIRFYSRGV